MDSGIPARVVSLEPSATSTLFELGQADRVVAVSRWCGRLVDVGDRPQLESTWSIRREVLTTLAPDLVVAGLPYSARGVEELLRSGLNVLFLSPSRLEDVFTDILLLGRLTGADSRAEALVADMRARIEGAAARSRGLWAPRVYVEVWSKPLFSGPGWMADLVEAMGGIFVPEGPGRRVSEEEVLEARPDVVVVAWTGVAAPRPEAILRRPRWQRVPAVEHGRVEVVDELLFNAPGPGLAQAANVLSDLVSRWAPHAT